MYSPIEISSLNDLRSVQNWNRLKIDLLKCWNDILYIDNVLDTSSFTEAELLAMKDFKNRNFWSAIKSNQGAYLKHAIKHLNEDTRVRLRTQ